MLTLAARTTLRTRMLTQRNAPRAFTLVELLVVIAIVSIVISLLMPALGVARRKAQTIICASNLRSIGQALTMYTQRYGCYPCGAIVDTPKAYAIWPVRLRPFTGGNQDVFYCPAQDERCRWNKVELQPGAPGTATEGHAAFGYEVGESMLDQDVTYFSYGYNVTGATGNGAYPPDEAHLGLGELLLYNPPDTLSPKPCELRSNRVRSPSDMIAVTDSTADGVGDAASHPSKSPASEFSNLPGPVHSDGSNVLFCDGHVQWLPRKALLLTHDTVVVSENPIRRMWNNNNRLNTGSHGE